jgi:hypothetical protein
LLYLARMHFLERWTNRRGSWGSGISHFVM